jgi:hypothetical protein
MRSLVLADPRGMTFSRNEKILYFLITAFFISLFLPGMPVINNIFTGAILLHSFFYNTFAAKKQLLRQRKAILFMLLFFLLHIISALRPWSAWVMRWGNMRNSTMPAGYTMTA